MRKTMLFLSLVVALAAMACRDSRGAALAMTPTAELAFAGGHLNAYSYLFDKRSVKTADDACDLIVSTDRDDAKVKVLGKTFSGRFSAVRMK